MTFCKPEFFQYKPFSDISKIHFKSSHHRRYNSGQWDGSENINCLRLFTILPDEEYDDSYIFTSFLLDGVHPQWKDNLSISPKRMEVVLLEPKEERIILQGFGSDPLLSNRPPQIQKDYGIIIQFDKSTIVTISLLFLDRQAQIVYYQ